MAPKISTPPSFPEKIGQIGAQWVLPGWNWGARTVRTITADRLYYIPIFVPAETAFDRIGVEVTSGATASSVLRLGIYRWSAGFPAALVLDAGTVVVDSNGQKLITIDKTLSRGYYFVAYVSDGAPQMYVCDGANGFMSPVHILQSNVDDPLDAAVPYVSGRTEDATGGLADPAPTPDSRSNTTFLAVRLRETQVV